MTNRRRMWGTAVVTACLLLSVAMSGTAAAADTTLSRPARLSCGDTVVRSTTLANDIGPCPGDGLIVGANGITVDLGGHRVLGTPGPDDNVGIRLPGRKGVTVNGGEVTGFGAGIAIQSGSGNKITGLRVHDNIGPLDGSGDFGDGIVIFNSPKNLVRGNTVRHNGPFDGIGVFGAPSRGNRIERNTVTLNNIARFSPVLGLFLNLDDGVNLGAGLEGGSHTTVSNNVITRNGLNGVNACSIRGNPCYTTDNVIVGNLVQANGFGDPTNPDDSGDVGDGIHVVGIIPPGMDLSDFFPPTRHLVATNRVLDNAGDGIVLGASQNRVVNNVALRNGRGIPDFFFDLEDLSLNNDCDANVWRGNTFGTATPECTTIGGRRAGPPSPAPGASSVAEGRHQRQPLDATIRRHFPGF